MAPPSLLLLDRWAEGTRKCYMEVCKTCFTNTVPGVDVTNYYLNIIAMGMRAACRLAAASPAAHL